MQKFIVTGMSCAACSARVEQAVQALPNVTSCAVNLLTKSMAVEGSASAKAIIDAVVAAGYGASQAGAKSTAQDPSEAAAEEIHALRTRLIASLIIGIPLLYLGMGHMLLGLPLPQALAQSTLAQGIVQMLLAGIVMVINQRFFTNGIKGLLHNAPNMDTLVCLGSGASFFWSVVVLLDLAMHGGGQADFYFESAGMIVALITVGKLLEAQSKGKTTDALKNLAKLSPKHATLVRGTQEIDVPIEEVMVGDIFLVKPGAQIPVDGLVLEGESSVNQAALTGESIPVDRKAGDRVFAATTNIQGFLRCQATHVGEDTSLAQIIQLVSDANATKAPIAKLADKISGIFVPLVLCLASITILLWILAGADLAFALARGIAVLVISCPCALGLATPVAIMVGSGLGAKHGILFKTAEALENTGKTAIVALDKTGTITTGTPAVTDVVPSEASDRTSLLTVLLALESQSEHPIASAIVAYAKAHNIERQPVTHFAATIGQGVTAKSTDETWAAGNLAFIETHAQISDALRSQAAQVSREGKTPIFCAKGSQILGFVAIADTLKADSKEAIADLKSMGIRVVMLTGDAKTTAKAIGDRAGVDGTVAGILPQQKDQYIQSFKTLGATAMVGDGINDAPALTRADTGIAIGAGTDVALDAADVVLLKNSLSDVAFAIRLSRATRSTIRQNLFWAFFYNSVGIPIAAGLLYPVFGITLSPILGALAMSLSSFCVVTNALRLNTISPKSPQKPIPNPVPIEAIERVVPKVLPQRILRIEGMMCPHCEKRVANLLLAHPEVVDAKVSHTSGTATLTLSAPLPNDVLQAEIAEAGYTLCESKEV